MPVTILNRFLTIQNTPDNTASNFFCDTEYTCQQRNYISCKTKPFRQYSKQISWDTEKACQNNRHIFNDISMRKYQADFL